MLQVASEQRLPFDVNVPAPETDEAIAELDTVEGERFRSAPFRRVSAHLTVTRSARPHQPP